MDVKLDKQTLSTLPIFITSMSRCDSEISSASLALAKVLSRNNKVFYIDYPYTILDVWRERKLASVKKRLSALLFGRKFLWAVEGQSSNFVALTPLPVLPINSFHGILYKLGLHINNKILSLAIKRVLKKYGFTDYIFFNSFNPNYLSDISRYLKPALSIYQSRDAIGEINEYTRRHGVENEKICIQNYDLTIATSKELCRNLTELTHKYIHYFPNGGDIQLFKKAIDEVFSKPIELQKIHTPIIGYTGAVCQRVDYELLVEIAEKHQDKTIVIVGPRQDKLHTSINLDAISNIIFVGSRKIDELPYYLQYFDCAIIPFKCNGFTKSIYPLKINEYLASGRSVVTTNFSEDIQGFASSILIANNHNEFLQYINDAIVLNSNDLKYKRLEAAATNSWENRVDLLWNLIWETYQIK